MYKLLAPTVFVCFTRKPNQEDINIDGKTTNSYLIDLLNQSFTREQNNYGKLCLYTGRRNGNGNCDPRGSK